MNKNNNTVKMKRLHSAIYSSMKLVIILVFLSYILLTYSRVGLLLWEIAPLIAVILLIPLTILVVFHIKRLKIGRKRRSILSMMLIVCIIIFQVWAIMPAILAPHYANNFDQIFINTFGENYESVIPESVRQKLSQEPFSWKKMLLRSVPNKYTVVKKIYYGNHTRQFFDIYYPLNVSGLNPAIIVIHGGATINASNDGIAEVMTARYFTAQGIIVISLEYRTPPEAHFIEMVTDVRTAIKWIRDHAEEYHINKKQIFVMGRSRGGHLATTAVYSGMNNNSWYMENAGNYTSNDLEVLGVICLYGAVNPYMAGVWGNNFIDERNKIVFGVGRDEAPDLYRNGSAAYLVGNNTPPTFIMHGSLDRMVSPKESRHLAQVLTENGILNVYLELPTGQHGFDALAWSPGGQLMYYYLERFIWYLIYSEP